MQFDFNNGEDVTGSALATHLELQSPQHQQALYIQSTSSSGYNNYAPSSSLYQSSPTTPSSASTSSLSPSSTSQQPLPHHQHQRSQSQQQMIHHQHQMQGISSTPPSSCSTSSSLLVLDETASGTGARQSTAQAHQNPVHKPYNRRNNPELEKRRIHHCDYPGNDIFSFF
jgi:hypothetical protein